VNDLLGQTHTISPEATNPAAWDSIFKTLGFEGGLVILLVAVGLTIAVLSGLLFYRISQWVFGPNGWMATAINEVAEKWKSAGVKVEECMPKIQEALAAGTMRQTDQLEMCKTHTENVQTTVRHGMLGLKEMAAKADCPEASRQFDLALDSLKG